MNRSPAVIPIPNFEQVVEVAFSPDSLTIGALHSDGSVTVLEVDSNKTYNVVFNTPPTSKLATSISFASPDIGTVFIVGDDSGRVHLYQKVKTNEFSLIITMTHHRAPINSLSFCPSSSTFVAAASDGVISITSCVNNMWNTNLVKLSDAPATSVSWSPRKFFTFIDNPNNEIDSDKFCASSADGFFAIYRLESNSFQPLGSPVQAHRGSVNCVSWRPLSGFSRHEIATCGDDFLIKIWRYDDNQWSSINIAQVQENPVFVKWSTCGFILSVGVGQNSVFFFHEVSKDKWSQLT